MDAPSLSARLTNWWSGEDELLLQNSFLQKQINEGWMFPFDGILQDAQQQYPLDVAWGKLELHLEMGGLRVWSWIKPFAGNLSNSDRFHTPGISMMSMCTGACHACTALRCDLQDPGWGDPRTLHCGFFGWHLSAYPLVFWFCPSVASMDDLLRIRHISCLVRIFTSSL